MLRICRWFAYYVMTFLIFLYKELMYPKFTLAILSGSERVDVSIYLPSYSSDLT